MVEDLLRREVSCTSLTDATDEDFRILRAHMEVADQIDRDELPKRMLVVLEALRGEQRGMQVDRLEHSLQSATRALRDGRDEPYVVCALLHDVGDLLAPANHAEVAAGILKPFVSEEHYWMVKHHTIVQSYYYLHHLGLDRNARDRYRNSPHFEATDEFCRLYDLCAFDPGYESMGLEEFEPMLRRVLSKPRRPLMEREESRP